MKREMDKLLSRRPGWLVQLGWAMLRRLVRAAAGPVWNPLRGLAVGALVHPLARIGPRVRIGRGCVIGRCRLDTMGGTGTLEIGDRTVIYGGVEVLVHGGRVRIGRDCLVTRGAAVLSGGHRFDAVDRPIREQEVVWADVEIGDDCWIGYRAIVLGGVRVGHGAVVGAGSVVARDVPAYAVVAGVPARVVGRRGEVGERSEFSAAGGPSLSPPEAGTAPAEGPAEPSAPSPPDAGSGQGS